MHNDIQVFRLHSYWLQSWLIKLTFNVAPTKQLSSYLICSLILVFERIIVLEQWKIFFQNWLRTHVHNVWTNYNTVSLLWFVQVFFETDVILLDFCLNNTHWKPLVLFSQFCSVFFKQQNTAEPFTVLLLIYQKVKFCVFLPV